ncbi:hypothetical protein OBBRIDRAFT_806124 [Obba rivulosa]|uniref:Uncharacterized protein n=1 Tax=Obba rivulosa TaxID=1052685 RepID=A0A8E2AMM3_9APHY|nr:hypothetical protein OBBRIDRAFT_806124 [Obba rivulosa]
MTIVYCLNAVFALTYPSSFPHPSSPGIVAIIVGALGFFAIFSLLVIGLCIYKRCINGPFDARPVADDVEAVRVAPALRRRSWRDCFNTANANGGANRTAVLLGQIVPPLNPNPRVRTPSPPPPYSAGISSSAEEHLIPVHRSDVDGPGGISPSNQSATTSILQVCKYTFGIFYYCGSAAIARHCMSHSEPCGPWAGINRCTRIRAATFAAKDDAGNTNNGCRGYYNVGVRSFEEAFAQPQMATPGSATARRQHLLAF